MQDVGYYYAMVKKVKVECYDVPASVKQEGSKSYVIYDQAGLESSVKITDKSTVLKSFLASGTDMNKELPKEASKDKEEAVETVPGMQGAGMSTTDIVEAEDVQAFDPTMAEDDGFTSRTDFTQGKSSTSDGAAIVREGRGSLFAFAAAVLVGVML